MPPNNKPKPLPEAGTPEGDAMRKRARECHVETHPNKLRDLSVAFERDFGIPPTDARLG